MAYKKKEPEQHNIFFHLDDDRDHELSEEGAAFYIFLGNAQQNLKRIRTGELDIGDYEAVIDYQKLKQEFGDFL